MRKRNDKAAYDRVKKAMTCAHYYNGGDCKIGTPVKECNPDGCIAWELHGDFQPNWKEKTHTLTEWAKILSIDPDKMAEFDKLCPPKPID